MRWSGRVNGPRLRSPRRGSHSGAPHARPSASAARRIACADRTKPTHEARLRPLAALKTRADAADGKVLHRPADFRDRSSRSSSCSPAACDRPAADRAVSDDRAAVDPDQATYPGASAETVDEHGDAGDRAADEPASTTCCISRRTPMTPARATITRRSPPAPIPTSRRCRCRTSCSWRRRCFRRKCSSKASGSRKSAAAFS